MIVSPNRAEKALIFSLLICFSLFLVYAQWLQKWDNVIYDSALKYDPEPSLDDVVIVAIDEQSLATLGRWPWPRMLHAELINILHQAGSKTVALNLIFSEAAPFNYQSDIVLADALRRHGRVILPVLPEQGPNAQFKESLPIATLVVAAAGLGHVDMELDQDGVHRRIFFKAGLGTTQWSQLTLAMLELEDENIIQSIHRLEKKNTPNVLDVWVRNYAALLPYAGPPGHFQRISYADVLSGHVPPDTFRNKYVLVGATAAGLGDTLPTPVSGFGQAMPGVEIQANILNALRRNTFVQPLNLSGQMLLTATLMLSALFWYSRRSSRRSLLITISLLIFPLIFSIVLLRSLHFWFPPSAALFGLGLSYLLLSWYHLVNATRLLSEQKERAEVTLHSISDAVIATDARGYVEYINSTAELLTGWVRQQALGQPINTLFRVINEQSREEIIYPVARCLQTGQVTPYPDYSAVLSQENNKERAVRASAAPIRNEKGKVLGVVVVFSDVTEARCMAQQMEHQATHDALTNLPNRALLHVQLQKAIGRTMDGEQTLALLFIDLDRFKAVNDGLGHACGDSLLKTVGMRLKASSRKGDLVARFGGDEFVIVLENIYDETQEAATAVARKIRKTLEYPYTIEDREYFITASIGISLFPGDGQDAETLLTNADAAMYQAKERGHNNIQYYSQEMNVHSRERLLLEEELRHAIERQQLVLHYQPQMEFKTGKVLGVEVLLRWQHPRFGLLAPAKFISLAEETGLIVSIGEWVIQAAAAQSKSWQESGLPQLRVAVNLSPRQFMEDGVTGMIARILEENRLDPRYLELEITESLIMRDLDSTVDTLQSLKSMGIQLAIDDFGTGYSSLSYLKRFPIDCLKIDQSFVRDIDTNSDDAAITLAIIAMAHSMKLKVIAEGVETKEQFNYLKSHSCDEVQGYYFSRPLPADKIAGVLKKAS